MDLLGRPLLLLFTRLFIIIVVKEKIRKEKERRKYQKLLYYNNTQDFLGCCINKSRSIHATTKTTTTKISPKETKKKQKKICEERKNVHSFPPLEEFPERWNANVLPAQQHCVCCVRVPPFIPFFFFNTRSANFLKFIFTFFSAWLTTHYTEFIYFFFLPIVYGESGRLRIAHRPPTGGDINARQQRQESPSRKKKLKTKK